MTHKEVITEIMNGNGNKFTVKEILQAHIVEDAKFKDFARKEFKDINIGMTENKTKVIMMGRVLKYGIAPVLIMIIGYLIGIGFMP